MSTLNTQLESLHKYCTTVKLGDKERFDKEQIGVKEPFPLTNLPIYFIWIGIFGVMAIRVLEFSNGGYKIRKILA